MNEKKKDGSVPKLMNKLRIQFDLNLLLQTKLNSGDQVCVSRKET